MPIPSNFGPEQYFTNSPENPPISTGFEQGERRSALSYRFALSAQAGMASQSHYLQPIRLPQFSTISNANINRTVADLPLQNIFPGESTNFQDRGSLQTLKFQISDRGLAPLQNQKLPKRNIYRESMMKKALAQHRFRMPFANYSTAKAAKIDSIVFKRPSTTAISKPIVSTPLGAVPFREKRENFFTALPAVISNTAGLRLMEMDLSDGAESPARRHSMIATITPSPKSNVEKRSLRARKKLNFAEFDKSDSSHESTAGSSDEKAKPGPEGRRFSHPEYSFSPLNRKLFFLALVSRKTKEMF